MANLHTYTEWLKAEAVRYAGLVTELVESCRGEVFSDSPALEWIVISDQEYELGKTLLDLGLHLRMGEEFPAMLGQSVLNAVDACHAGWAESGVVPIGVVHVLVGSIPGLWISADSDLYSQEETREIHRFLVELDERLSAYLHDPEVGWEDAIYEG